MRSMVLGLLLAISSLPGVAAEDEKEDRLTKAAEASARGDVTQAIKVLSEAIEKDPSGPLPYYLRGREHFRAGNIKQSVADFDKHVDLEKTKDPKAEARQWERGISYYYAGDYEKGARQFEMYQTYDARDVENSTWRYLCVARKEGVDKARETLLPIEGDRRIPMMAIYDLYRGKLKPEDVLAAAKEGEPSKPELNQRLFYAHLYIGLWHEAAGDKDLARKHILEAEKHKIGHYMWDVAHVHAELLRKNP